jgi:hypothetical protein
MTKSLQLVSVERTSNDGELERLDFSPGVNTIYGKKDAGKTKWLDMIDFLLGGTSSPSDTFGSALAKTYSSLRGVIAVGSTQFVIERRWQEKGAQGKIYVDDKTLTAQDFSPFLLHHLDIPRLHYPKGDPYADRKWPELSWKTIYRHIYRTEKSWHSIAANQSESEQFATQALFLGIAEKLFSPELGSRVNKQKERSMLEARRQQFQSLLDQITARLSSPESPLQFATEAILTEQIGKFEQRINQLVQEREALLSEGATMALSAGQITRTDIELSERRGALVSELELLSSERQEATKRHRDILLLANSVAEEVERLKRAKLAGDLLDQMKATHCPVCDQSVSPKRVALSQCYMCLQNFEEGFADTRLEFEISQMDNESQELQELARQLSADEKRITNRIEQVKEELALINQTLVPAQTKSAGLFHPRISSVDIERGRLQEQVLVLQRILELFRQRDELAADIDRLSAEIAGLDATRDTQKVDLALEEVALALEDGIMTYLQALNAGDPNRWTKKRIEVRLTEYSLSFRINGRNWSSELGATSTAYFLLAYQYALLTLSQRQGFHYPGICLMDFPASLQDGTTLAGTENFLVEPFVSLCKSRGDSLQVIVAGRSFQSLEGANPISLIKAWTE